MSENSCEGCGSLHTETQVPVVKEAVTYDLEVFDNEGNAYPLFISGIFNGNVVYVKALKLNGQEIIFRETKHSTMEFIEDAPNMLEEFLKRLQK